MNISMADKETMASLLDQLGESTGGYFFIMTLRSICSMCPGTSCVQTIYFP